MRWASSVEPNRSQNITVSWRPAGPPAHPAQHAPLARGDPHHLDQLFHEVFERLLVERELPPEDAERDPPPLLEERSSAIDDIEEAAQAISRTSAEACVAKRLTLDTPW